MTRTEKRDNKHKDEGEDVYKCLMGRILDKTRNITKNCYAALTPNEQTRDLYGGTSNWQAVYSKEYAYTKQHTFVVEDRLLPLFFFVCAFQQS